MGEYIHEIFGYWVLQKLPKIYHIKKMAPPLLFSLYGKRQGQWGTTLTLKSLKLKITIADRVLLFNEVPGLQGWAAQEIHFKLKLHVA